MKAVFLIGKGAKAPFKKVFEEKSFGEISIGKTMGQVFIEEGTTTWFFCMKKVDRRFIQEMIHLFKVNPAESVIVCFFKKHGIQVTPLMCGPYYRIEESGMPTWAIFTPTNLMEIIEQL